MRWPTSKEALYITLVIACLHPAARAQDDLDALLGGDTAAARPAEARNDAEPSAAEEPQALDTIAVGSGQEMPAEAVAAGRRPSSRLVEEIVVTAQKREENLQDVPVSVAAFSGDQLQALGVDNPKDLGNVTPGFVTNDSLGFAAYSIRGVGSDIFVPSADTGVATYVDGIYQPLPIGLATDFGRLERIEVLKGPQGTLYGRNTVGGAVNIITRKPAEQLEVYVRGERASFDTTRLKVYVSGPLYSDVVSAGISAIRNRSQTYYRPAPESVIQGFADDVTEGINPRVMLRLGDDLDLTLSAMYVKLTGPSVMLGTLDPWPAYDLLMADQGDYEVSRDSVEDHWQNENLLGYLELNWRLPMFGVKLLASHQDQEQRQPIGALDYDQSELPLATARQDPAFGKVDTVELQLSSTPGGWLAEDFVWTAGLYYYHAVTGIDPMYLAAAPLQTDRLPLIGALPLPPIGVTLASHGILATDALAGFGQMTWHALDWLSLTLGARYQVEDRGLTRADSNLVNPDGSETRIDNYPLDSVTTRRFSPKVSLEFRPFGGDTLLYASFQQATKSGTFNVVNFSAPPSAVRPQDVTAYEAGLKGTLLDGGLRYDLAVYHYEIDDFQAQYVSVSSGGALNLYNAPSAYSRGAEGNLVWQVFPEWNPGFALSGGVAFMDAHFDEFPNGSGYDEQTGLFFGERALAGPLAPPRDFTGNEMTASPELTATLGINQLLQAPGGEIEIGVQASYNSGFFFDVQNMQRASQPEYCLIGARLSYLFEQWQLRATLSGQNLTDELYYRSRFTFDFGTASQVAPPRSLAFSLEWDFQ